VKVGDVVNVHTEIVRVGISSITVRVEAWIDRRERAYPQVRVTGGTFTYVAIDEQGRKRTVPPA
jgi:acyl-CoA thioesterase YciA